MPHPLLVRAAQLIEQARALNDEFEDKSKMPAEVAGRIDRLLGEASNCRQHVEREAAIDDHDKWLHEPEYKHDMSYTGGTTGGTTGGGSKSTGLAPGEFLTDKERAESRSKAFFEYVRKGDAMAPEMKAALVEDATGQLLIPEDFAGTILKDLPRQSVIRNLAFVRPTRSNKVEVGSVVIASGGWGKLETGTVAADGLGATPAAKDTVEVHDLNALVKLGRDELEDSDEDLAGLISEALTLQFGEQTDDAYAFGTGTGQPTGIAQRAIGATPTITQGVAAAAGQTATGDELKRVTFQVPAWAARNAVWLGNKSAEEKIALLKDSNGNYLWQPRVSESEPATLFGYRWYRVDGLPAITATNDAGAGTDPSVMFGDVRRGYMIADRRGVLVQRLEERYADEGKIGLLFTLRTGGDVIRPKAFAFYKL